MKIHLKKIVYNKYFLQLVLTLIPTVLLVVVPMQFSFLDPVTKAFKNFSLSDLYQKSMKNEELRKSNEIYVLDITPFRERDEIAAIIKSLDEVNPKVIGLDVLFRQHSDSLTEQDLILKKTINELNSTLIYGYRFTSDGNKADYSYFMPEEHKDAYAGYTNTTIENKYVECLRDFTLCKQIDDSIYDSFIFKVAKTYNPSVKRSKKALNTNYTDVAISVISPHEISPLLNGKIVLIGLASGYEDLFYTPVGDMPGVVVLAHNIYNLLHDNYIKDVHWIISLLLSLVLCVFAIWFYNFCKKTFKIAPLLVYKCFLSLYSILLAFINIIICFYLRMSIPFTLAFVSFIFIGTAYELQKIIYHHKKLT